MATPIPKEIDDKVKARFWAKVDIKAPDQCWNWQGYTDRGGYGQFCLKKKRLAASRFSLMLTLGRKLGPKECACHTCDNPSCCNPKHLFVGTHGDNMRDAAKKGRLRTSPRHNEANTNAKLNWSKVSEIRSLQGVISPGQMVEKFNVSYQTISRVLLETSWPESERPKHRLPRQALGDGEG